MRTTFLTLLLGFSFSALCHGQANDVGIMVGGIFSPNSVGLTPAVTPVSFPPACVDCLAPNAATSGVAFEGVLAHRLLSLDHASLHLELPVMVAPNRSGTGVGNFWGVFVTPALKVKFSLPLVSPFLSAGGGFAHFSPKNNNASGTKGAFQVGGGLDISTPIPRIGFRAEIREFYTGTYASTQHNLFAGGGIVFKF